MNDYINYGKKRKFKKPIIILLCVVAVFIIVIGFIGITKGSNSEERKAVSSAVTENIELKQQMSEMQGTIDGLNQTIDELEKELESRPTISPTPYAGLSNSSPSPTPSVQSVPRERIKN